MLEFLMLLTLFVRPVYSAVLLILGMGTDEIPLSVIYIGVAIVDYVYLLTKHLFRYKVNEKMWVAGIFMAVLLILQVVTGMEYGGLKGEYLSSVLSFGSLSIVSFFFGYAFVQKGDFVKLGKILPFFILILSGVTLYADITTIESWNGLFHSEISYNVDYQNCTYYAAYALGLTGYYLLYGKELKTGSFAGKMKWLFALLLPFQAFVIMTSGGRGGFLLGVFLIVYFLVVLVVRYQKKPAYYVAVIAVLSIAAVILTVYLANNGNSIRGFSRLTGFLANPEDKERDSLYSLAVEYFCRRPIAGNGIGSVWFTVGYYSHHIFCDLLCETGIIGTGIALAGLAVYAARTWMLIRRAPVYQFGLLIFFFVFIMLIFSGYYLTEPMLWFALAFTFFAEIPPVKRTNEDITD